MLIAAECRVTFNPPKRIDAKAFQWILFLVDSGSNVILFKSILQGIKLHDGDINVATANSDSNMHITQKAILPLQTEMNTLIEFSDSYYSKNLQDNLMSVGIACDANLVMVFCKRRLRVFQDEDFTATGNQISSVNRDANTGLYYWKLFSQVKTTRNDAYAALARDFTQRVKQSPDSTSITTLRAAFAGLLPLCESANAALGRDREFRAVDLNGPLTPQGIAALSKSYEQNLTKFELLHGRLGHLNTKIIELVYEVKLPKKTGCIECVHGKGHHVGAKNIEKSESTDRNLKAGEMFECDFIGPFAGSIGHNKYCENFLDRKTGYPFIFPSPDQLAHYTNFPKMYAEARGRSGNAMRFFKTDHGKVYTGERGRAMLRERSVVAEYSPPYNHLKRCERFNRTSEEATKTNMLTAGAPQSHWAMVNEMWVFVWTHIAVIKQPDGTYLSRANLFENNKRYFDPEHFRAYGTFALRFIPVEARKTGKGPGGETHEPGIIVGYLDGGDGYLFMSFHPLRYNSIFECAFGDITTFEGVYPLRNKRYWTNHDLNSPRCYMPTLQALLDPIEWAKFQFTPEEEETAISKIVPRLEDEVKDIISADQIPSAYSLDAPSMEIPSFGGYNLRPRESIARPPIDEPNSVPEPLEVEEQELAVHVPAIHIPEQINPSPPLVEVKQESKRPAEVTPDQVVPVKPPPLEGKYEPQVGIELPHADDDIAPPLLEPGTPRAHDPPVPSLEDPVAASNEDGLVIMPELVAAREIFPQPGEITYCLEFNEAKRVFEVEELVILPTKRKDDKTKQERTPKGHVEVKYTRTGELAVMPRWNLNWTRDEAQIRCDESNVGAVEVEAALLAIKKEALYSANRAKWETDWNQLDFMSMLECIPSPVTEKSASRVRQAAAKVAANAEVDPLFDKPIGIPPPTTLKEVQESKWRKYYEAAGDAEMKTLEANHTWDIVDLKDVPKGTTIVGSKIVYADKRGPTGTMMKFKARVVAKGFSQKYMQDYFDTYASVVEFKTIRLLLAHYNQNPDWSCEAWDAEAAFVQPNLEETVYMRIPPPYDQKHSGKVYKLKKCLYGLKQAARAWQKFCQDIMEANDGKSCPRDQALYIFRQGKAFLIIATHVDDFFVFFNRYGAALRDNVWDGFVSKCKKINNLGPIRWALKTCIEEDKEAGILKISLEGFATAMVQRFDLGENQYADTPAIASGKDAKITEDDLPKTNEEKALAAKFPVREVTGCAWWMIHICRVDIYNATLRISRWQNAPCAKLWRWCLQLLRYINKTKALGIVYRRQQQLPKHIFTGAADASLADVVGADDAIRSKSTLSWLLFYYGALITWGCKTSTRILGSSCEAECSALVELSKDNRWFRALIFYLGLHDECGTMPTLVREDNQAAITLSGERVIQGRSRHFELEWDSCRESISLGEMSLFWIKTENQWADLNTKSLSHAIFARHVNSIMGNEDLQNYFKQAVAKMACMKFIQDEDCDKNLYSALRAKFYNDAADCAALTPVYRPQAHAARWFSQADY